MGVLRAGRLPPWRFSFYLGPNITQLPYAMCDATGHRTEPRRWRGTPRPLPFSLDSWRSLAEAAGLVPDADPLAYALTLNPHTNMLVRPLEEYLHVSCSTALCTSTWAYGGYP